MARVAILLPRLSRYGGVEGFGWRLAAALAARGHAVDFICAKADTPPAGVKIVKALRLGPTRALKILSFALSAESRRKAGNYDLTVGLGKTLRQDLLRLAGCPILEYHRLTIRAWPPGFSRLLKRLNRLFSPSTWLVRAIEARQLAGAPHLAANSRLVADWTRADHPAIFKMGGDRAMSVIVNRADPGRFPPVTAKERAAARARLELPEDCRAIGFAGTNFVLKGLRGLLEAMALLPPECRLLVAGGRDAGAWRRLAEDLGVARRVTFLGKVDDMPGFYAALDCFALPTFSDACANATLEALSRGIPSLTSAANGAAAQLPPEWVISDPGDPAEIARAVLRALSGPRPALPEILDASGMDAWVELIERLLAEKSR